MKRHEEAAIFEFITLQKWDLTLHQDNQQQLVHEALCLVILSYLIQHKSFTIVGIDDSLQELKHSGFEAKHQSGGNMLPERWNRNTGNYTFQLRHRCGDLVLLKIMPLNNLLLLHIGNMATETLVAYKLEYVRNVNVSVNVHV